jgi:proteasome accessory factor C
VPGLEDRSALSRLIAKLEAAAGEAALVSAQVAVQVDIPDHDAEGYAGQIRAALSARRRVHLRYYVPGRDETTERDVDPVRLRWADGRWYLEAWCRSVGAMRFFRIDRVDAVEILDEPSAPPADVVPRDLSEGIYQPAPEHPLVTLRLDQPGRWVAEYYACETASPLPDGRLEVTLRAADPAWMRRLVLGLGPAAEVVGPAWLVEQVRSEAAEALAAYG